MIKREKQTAQWLVSAYHALNEHFGNLHWWPGDSPLEIIVGAILTQNTAWQNVEKAIVNLKAAHLLSSEALLAMPESDLAEMIRPSGYYNIKARRLKSFFIFLQDCFHGNLDVMLGEEIKTLREKLLQVKGIGEETADSILLYAVGKPVFVVDAYTRRILTRHGVIRESLAYVEIQRLFMKLPHDAPLYNQYHALLVNTGKNYCNKKKPQCQACPLNHLNELQVSDIYRQ
ncbi:MAG: endonuclease III domain-containing protein [Syntrophales bacterium]|jgi:endonuclease-3 related protein|nr:endonuclease III domain-containing protein [Syntrophales bacterium]